MPPASWGGRVTDAERALLVGQPRLRGYQRRGRGAASRPTTSRPPSGSLGGAGHRGDLPAGRAGRVPDVGTGAGPVLVPELRRAVAVLAAPKAERALIFKAGGRSADEADGSGARHDATMVQSAPDAPEAGAFCSATSPRRNHLLVINQVTVPAHGDVRERFGFERFDPAHNARVREAWG